jgi:hypothetical protein
MKDTSVKEMILKQTKLNLAPLLILENGNGTAKLKNYVKN